MADMDRKIGRIRKEAAAGGPERDAQIVRTSLVGVAANAVLAGLKAFVGLVTGSIAVTMDAVNNLSDAASSLITIVGTKLAARQPDREHPFGYGRVEYLSAMVISLLVLYAGVTAFTESMKRIADPVAPDYTAGSLAIVAVGVAVKLLLGRYVKGVGRRVRSDSLINSGEDARLDAVISASTLLAAALSLLFGLRIEAWLAAAIALFIIRSGIGMLLDTLSRLLGERADAALAGAIRRTVTGFEPVSGAYDLILNNYGPEFNSGSIHIEVPDTMTANELDSLSRRIADEVYLKHGVALTAIGIYSVNTRDPGAVKAREKAREIALGYADVLQLHGFYFDEREKRLRFDLMIGFGAKDREKLFEDICGRMREAFPGYDIQAAMDTDLGEER